MTTDRSPQEKTFGELSPGALVDPGDGTVYRVNHTEMYRTATGEQRVALMVTLLGPDDPTMWKRPADGRIMLASDEMVADARARQQRSVLVSGLGLIADRVRSHVLPLPAFGARVTVAVASAVELSLWADAFGGEVRETAQAGWVFRELSVDLGDGDAMSLSLDVACPATLAEHRHVAGSNGGPGACSAVCACGAAVAGFDTLGEAVAALDQHIADPEPADDTTGGDR
ncbi:hypothetical protein ABZ847_29265 [Streptomyces bauhiniae]